MIPRALALALALLRRPRALATAGVSAQPQSARIPLPPIRTSLGTMPGVAELPARPEMPDIMTFESGMKVTTPAQWKQRREEMRRIR